MGVQLEYDFLVYNGLKFSGKEVAVAGFLCITVGDLIDTVCHKNVLTTHNTTTHSHTSHTYIHTYAHMHVHTHTHTHLEFRYILDQEVVGRAPTPVHYVFVLTATAKLPVPIGHPQVGLHKRLTHGSIADHSVEERLYTQHQQIIHCTTRSLIYCITCSLTYCTTHSLTYCTTRSLTYCTTRTLIYCTTYILAAEIESIKIIILRRSHTQSQDQDCVKSIK